MRITQQILANNVLTNMNSLRSRMADLQQQVSTGRRFEAASGDPTAAGDVMRAQSRLESVRQWETNQTSTKTWLDNTEAQLGHLTDVFGRLKELASRANNSSVNNQDRQAMAVEVNGILEDVLSALNTQGPDGALFGGFATAGSPFSIDMATGVVTYSGDSGSMQREVGPGINVTANIHGNRLGNWAGPGNMLTELWQFAQDLQNWPPGGSASAHLQAFDAQQQNMLSLRAEVGAKGKRMDQMSIKTQEIYLQMQEVLQQAQGADMEKAIIDLNTAENTYRAALQVGARIVPPTLVDFLR